MDLEDELELSPRFVAALLRGGTGVGVLQRAHDELTRRAHNMWLETGRSDDKANWEDAERTLVRWRRQPETGSEGTPGLDALMCDSPMDAIDGGFAMDFAANREELAELCITLQANLHAAKAALQQEKCAVRALRKDLQAERARSKRFSFKLMAAEAQLYKETAAPCMQVQQGRAGTTTQGIPVLKALDGLKDAWQEAEHYSLTPRARVRRRLYSSPTQSSCSDCEACEISSPASGATHHQLLGGMLMAKTQKLATSSMPMQMRVFIPNAQTPGGSQKTARKVVQVKRAMQKAKTVPRAQALPRALVALMVLAMSTDSLSAQAL